jgi:hypothetical protein
VSSGTGEGAVGSRVQAVTFSVTNTGCSALSVTSVAISLINPKFFSALGLTNGTLSGSIGSTATFNVCAPPIAADGSPDFSLTGTIALARSLPMGVTQTDQQVSQVTIGGASATGQRPFTRIYVSSTRQDSLVGFR